jgi:hypothetical protein
LAQYINRSNSFGEAKYVVPLGMSELKKLNLYEMLNLKIKLDYPKPYIPQA